MKRLAVPAAGVLTLAVGLAFATSAAHARDGIYLDVSAGAAFLDDTTVSQFGALGVGVAEPGYSFSGAVGYALDLPPLGGTWRVEVEGIYRDNQMDEIELFGSIFALGGRATVIALMMNSYYDFDLGGGWRPYLGFGVGGARVKFDIESAGGASLVNDRDDVIAFQGAAGMGLEIFDNLTISLGYRYFATENLSLTDSVGLRYETEYLSHTVETRVRFVF